MKIFLFAIILFFYLSVGAQTSDTLYFDAKWNVIDKGKNFAFYSIKQTENDTTHVIYFYKKGKKYSEGKYQSTKEKKWLGNYIRFEKNGDTNLIISYKNGKNENEIYFEEGKRIKWIKIVNDSTYYRYIISGGKYIVAKSLLMGEYEYIFQGKDSILNLEKLSLAFRKSEPSTNYYILKYKMLPWILGEDVGMNYTLGIEYTFNKIHSVELTATYFDWDQDQEDSFGNPLPSIYNVRRSLQLGYRYYFPKFKKQKNEYRLFVSPYIRYSKWKDHYSEGAVTNYFQNESWNYISGINFGISLDISGENDASYTEFFIGPTYFSRYTEEGFTDNNLTIHQNYYTNKFGLRIGMNFCGLLERKK